MTRFLFIRHAATESVGKQIAGRTAGIPLASDGQEQASRVALRLSEQSIAAVYSSPQPRACETAQVLASAVGKDVQVAPELDEVDYGDWTGRMIDELQSAADWQAFNTIRSCTRIPHGEFILEVQARVVGLVERLRAHYREESVALVSHAEVIRAALVYYLGLPLDMMLRLELNPASISIVEIQRYGPIIRCVNNTELLCP
jgi:probable phosphoglycerate mutase